MLPIAFQPCSSDRQASTGWEKDFVEGSCFGGSIRSTWARPRSPSFCPCHASLAGRSPAAEGLQGLLREEKHPRSHHAVPQPQILSRSVPRARVHARGQTDDVNPWIGAWKKAGGLCLVFTLVLEEKAKRALRTSPWRRGQRIASSVLSPCIVALSCTHGKWRREVKGLILTRSVGNVSKRKHSPTCKRLPSCL